MKWQDSLKTKNIIFFSLISFLFLISIIISFTLLKAKELPIKANSEITLATSELIQELLIEEQRNEQIVLSMSIIGSQKKSKNLIKELLEESNNQEIISASIWIDENSAKKREDTLVYHFSRDGDKFKEIFDYKQDMSVFYKKMKFYSFAKHLKKGKTFWTKMYFDTLSQTKVISVLAPIYKDKTYIGVASLNIKFSLCENNIFRTLVSSEEKYFILVDRVGNVVVSSYNINEIGKHKNIKDLNIPILKELLHKRSKTKYVKRVNRTITMLENDPIFNEKSVIASYDFSHTGWRMLISIPNHIIFKEMNSLYKKTVLLIILFAILTALIGYFLIKKSIVNPLISISQQIQDGGIDDEVMIHTKEKGEIELVVYKLNARNRALREAHDKEVRNEKLLLQQSKMAAMGEMLDAVAHQWKQPLNAISMLTDLISIDFKDKQINKKYMKDFQTDIHRQIGHMSDTLSTFRSFFRPDTKMQEFTLLEAVNDVLLLAKDELIKNTIEVKVVEKDSLTIFGSKNEIKHLVLNIINNAKDAFVQNNIENRLIKITLLKEKDKNILIIEDNAGGIPNNIIKDIFMAHVTSKAKDKGTGIGLYMSAQIVQKHHAELSVSNKNSGASFMVTFKQENLQYLKNNNV